MSERGVFEIHLVERDNFETNYDGYIGVRGVFNLGGLEYELRFEKKDGKWEVFQDFDENGSIIRFGLGKEDIAGPVIADDMLVPDNFEKIVLNDSAYLDVEGYEDRFELRDIDIHFAEKIVKEAIAEYAQSKDSNAIVEQESFTPEDLTIANMAIQVAMETVHNEGQGQDEIAGNFLSFTAVKDEKAGEAEVFTGGIYAAKDVYAPTGEAEKLYGVELCIGPKDLSDKNTISLIDENGTKIETSTVADIKEESRLHQLLSGVKNIKVEKDYQFVIGHRDKIIPAAGRFVMQAQHS